MKEFNKVKIVFGICLTVILLSFVGCGKKKEKTGSTKQMDLYDRGLEAIDSMNALAKDENYINALGVDKNVRENVYKISSCEYDKLIAVYEINNLYSTIETFVTLGGISVKGDTKEFLIDRATLSMSNIIIQYASNSSSYDIASSTMLSYENAFVCDEVKEPVVYIYCYQDCYPIMVAAVPKEDGVVCLKATYLNVDSLINCEPEFLADTIRGYYLGASINNITK